MGMGTHLVHRPTVLLPLVNRRQTELGFEISHLGNASWSIFSVIQHRTSSLFVRGSSETTNRKSFLSTR